VTDRFDIARLGSQGDGVAETATGQVFIPFALPGEVVTAVRNGTRAELVAIEQPSPQRALPACRHFGVCGSCAVQHLEAGAYLTWKEDKVVQALRGRGLSAEVTEIVACAPHSRRRVVLSARRTASGILLGYSRASSHDLFDIAECPVSVPEIVRSFPALRRLAALIARGSNTLRMTVTATASGLDIAVQEAGRLSGPERRATADFTIREGFARLTVDGDIVVEPRKPVILIGPVAVTPPPGAFTQATEFAEQTMADLVIAHLAPARRVADLFAGWGSFALRLAGTAEVHAVENDPAPLAALERARRNPRLKAVSVERRDLFRRPLTAGELAAFEGLVFDPPRAGAEDQSKQIARSGVPLVAAVSCNPQTLARDLSILVEGGYALRKVVPIDQFLWSPHVEAVALLEKPRSRRGRTR
jgi:23S rRNA (uracil1939-C5)-methyltransferase